MTMKAAQEEQARPDELPVLVHKAEAARIVGISVSEFKRREQAGRYTHVDVDRNGYRLYDRAFMESRRGERRQLAPPARVPLGVGPSAAPASGRYKSDEVARVFAELRKDEDLVRIVETTGIDPDVVESIYLRWISLRTRSGGFHLGGETVQQLAKLPLDGFPVSTERELLAALRALANFSEPCEGCEERPKRVARLCLMCERALLEKTIATPKAASTRK